MDYRNMGIYYPFIYINMLKDVKIRTSSLRIRSNAIKLIIMPLLEKALQLGFDYRYINRVIYKEGKVVYMSYYDMLELMSVKEMIDILKWFYESKGIDFEERYSIITKCKKQ